MKSTKILVDFKPAGTGATSVTTPACNSAKKRCFDAKFDLVNVKKR